MTRAFSGGVNRHEAFVLTTEVILLGAVDDSGTIELYVVCPLLGVVPIFHACNHTADPDFLAEGQVCHGRKDTPLFFSDLEQKEQRGGHLDAVLYMEQWIRLSLFTRVS